MPRSPEERAYTERLEDDYRRRHADVLLEIEQEVFARDYGGTSWTDRAEAGRLADWLGLGPGVRLLEVGAGTGWPGVYLAHRHGCEATLCDVAREGLRAAERRAVADGLAARVRTVAADAVRLPFRPSGFDALVHCDVLC